MPKFLVKMNVVEAKVTSFVIEADSTDDIHDALGELDFTYFEDNCRWTSSDYEPPIIEDISPTKKNTGICTLEQNTEIQNKYNEIIKELSGA